MRRKTKKLIEDLSIAVARMDKRVRDLETLTKLLRTELEQLKAETGGESMSSKMQAGIDSIMGYQWPPAKGGNR